MSKESGPGDLEYDRQTLTAEEKEKRAEVRKALIKGIDEVLKKAGFKKQASTWRRELADVIQVINLQRSSFSFLYYLNLGIFIKAVDPKKQKPDEVDCHFHTRFEHAIVEDSHEMKNRAKVLEVAKLLDFEDSSTPPAEKISEFKELIEKKILPFFSELDSLAAIKDKNIKDITLPAKRFVENL